MENEIRTNVTCVLVDITCERCKKGNLNFQLKKDDKVFIHKCKSCLRTFELDTKYPHIEYVKEDGSSFKV